MRYPTLEVISNIEEANIFPSVSVCNNNPVSRINLERRVNGSELFNQQVKMHFKSKFQRNKYLFSSVSRDSSTEISHQFRDMVLHCRYKSDDKCVTKNSSWKLFQSSELFNCYTFSPYELKHENDDLSLILYKENSTHQSNKCFTNPTYHRMDTSNIMTFSIHGVEEMPDVIQKTLSVQTGMKMSVILSGNLSGKVILINVIAVKRTAW